MARTLPSLINFGCLLVDLFSIKHM